LDQELDFEIISDEDENGQLLVSIRRIQYRQAWQVSRFQLLHIQ
jgi:small subunit ribosomal protein S1